MSLVSSSMLPLGSEAPYFKLPDPQGKLFSLDDFDNSKGLLVVFICNHCPYVKHIKREFSRIAAEYQKYGIAIVGINSNDFSQYPEDSPENMAREIGENGYTFPYLYDESQKTARDYHAVCTPDFFLFNEDRSLIYRGQMDESRPGNNIPVTGKDLREALDAFLDHRPLNLKQKPSMGCNIKWK